MVATVRVARVLLTLMLALLAISSVMGVGTSSTGPMEKLALLVLTGGCVYAAVKVTALSDWILGRLARR